VPRCSEATRGREGNTGELKLVMKDIAEVVGRVNGYGTVRVSLMRSWEFREFKIVKILSKIDVLIRYSPIIVIKTLFRNYYEAVCRGSLLDLDSSSVATEREGATNPTIPNVP
jgi:hypothetical protein